MKINSRFRAGIIFGVILAIFNIGFDLLNLDSYESGEVIKAIVAGLIEGALAGLLFGWIIGLFLKSNYVKTTTKIETEADEDILFDTPANHFQGKEGVGGKLYLTNKRLVFKSHNLNFQNHELSISLNDIENVDRYKNLGFIDNGLIITTSQSAIEKFVVEHVEEWIKRLTFYKSHQQLLKS